MSIPGDGHVKNFRKEKAMKKFFILMGFAAMFFIVAEQTGEIINQRNNDRRGKVFVDSLLHDNDVLRFIRKSNRHAVIYFYPSSDYQDVHWDLTINDGANDSSIDGTGKDLNLAFEDFKKEFGRLHPVKP